MPFNTYPVVFSIDTSIETAFIGKKTWLLNSRALPWFRQLNLNIAWRYRSLLSLQLRVRRRSGTRTWHSAPPCWLPSSDGCRQVAASTAPFRRGSLCSNAPSVLSSSDVMQPRYVYVLPLHSVFLGWNSSGELLHNRYYHARNLTCQGERWNTEKTCYSSPLLLRLGKLIAR